MAIMLAKDTKHSDDVIEQMSMPLATFFTISLVTNRIVSTVGTERGRRNVVTKEVWCACC